MTVHLCPCRSLCQEHLLLTLTASCNSGFSSNFSFSGKLSLHTPSQLELNPTPYWSVSVTLSIYISFFFFWSFCNYTLLHYFLLVYSCFTVLCQFLLCSTVTQPYMCACVCVCVCVYTHKEHTFFVSYYLPSCSVTEIGYIFMLHVFTYLSLVCF